MRIAIILVVSVASSKQAVAAIPEPLPVDQVLQNIEQCKADPTVAAYIDRVLALGNQRWMNGDWVIPFWVDPVGSPTYLQNPLLPSPPYPINGTRASFEWLANVLPSKYNAANNKTYAGLPPNYPNQLNPLYNFETDFASRGYKKFPSIPTWIFAFTGKDPFTSKSADLRSSIFITNLEDRGTNNLLKKRYMSALTCDKLPLYESKINAAINNFYNDIVVDQKPVLSSWRNRAYELYFDLHLHGTDHPSYVTTFARNFATQLAPGDDEFIDRRRDALIEAHCTFPYVSQYFLYRQNYIMTNNIDSTLVYWWTKAKMPKQTVIFEAVHNSFGWSQFVSTLFLVIRAQIVGYLAATNLINPSIFRINLFRKMKLATTANQRLDVAREVFRLLLPNSFWMSATQNSPADLNISTHTLSYHVPFFIQLMNDNYDPASANSRAGTYDTKRYVDFQPSGCPFSKPKKLAARDFMASSIDGETVVPKSHAKYFPVFKAGSASNSTTVNGPKYCPFGLGYRRCPAELFNMLIVQKLLDKLNSTAFYMNPPANLFDKIGLDSPDYNTSIPMGVVRHLDNLFAYPPRS